MLDYRVNPNGKLEYRFTTMLLTAALTSVVEEKSLDESFEQFDLSDHETVKHLVAPQSSPEAKTFMQQQFLAKFNLPVDREEGSNLYLVKKVFCFPGDYDNVASCLSDKDRQSGYQGECGISVSMLISQHNQLMGMSGKNNSIEVYLESGKNGTDALRNTIHHDPTFKRNIGYLFCEPLREFDELVTDAVYKHTLKAVSKVANRNFGVDF